MYARTARDWAVFVAATLLCGCEPESGPTTATTLSPGLWQAQISVPGGEIDTAIELNREEGLWQAQLINGQERVSIDEVQFEDGRLTLRFPAFNNHITATVADDELRGTLTIIRRHGEQQVLPFHARRGIAASASEVDAADVDMSGRWAVRFHDPDGVDSASIGEFAQRGSRLYGTFLNPNGDHRFLAGYVRGRQFKLSTFDGAHAFLFSGEVVDDEIREADFWSGDSWHQQWSGQRSPDIELPDAFSRTYLKPGYDRLEFQFPNVDGAMVSLDDEKFQGKVVVVTIAGTWCPNCNDEARFMAPLYRQYRERGLEVVALMFEHFLSAVLAWPTTIFIDRSGRVRNIHTGFLGPGTGEHYQELQKKMTGIITTLLDEPDNLLESLTREKPDS
jgi:thiol-disulfide isomerase/thioredoxin